MFGLSEFDYTKMSQSLDYPWVYRDFLSLTQHSILYQIYALTLTMTRKGQNCHLMTSHFNIPGFQRQRNPSSLPVKKASFFWSKMAARTIVFRTDLSEKSAKGFNFCFFEVSTRRQGRVGQAEPARTKSCCCELRSKKKKKKNSIIENVLQ